MLKIFLIFVLKLFSFTECFQTNTFIEILKYFETSNQFFSHTKVIFYNSTIYSSLNLPLNQENSLYAILISSNNHSFTNVSSYFPNSLTKKRFNFSTNEIEIHTTSIFPIFHFIPRNFIFLSNVVADLYPIIEQLIIFKIFQSQNTYFIFLKNDQQQESLYEIFPYKIFIESENVQNLENLEVNYQRSNILNGKSLIVKGLKVHSVGLYTSKNGLILGGSGALYKMTEAFASNLNFSFVINFCPGGSGTLDKNKIWNGCMGEITGNGKADLALGCGISESRYLSADSTSIYIVVDRTFFIKIPYLAKSWKIIFQSFSMRIWLLIILFPFLLILAIFWIKNRTFEIEKLTRIILEQTWTFVNRDESGADFQINVLICWGFFCLIIGTLYKARLFENLSFIDKEIVPSKHGEIAFSNYQLYWRSYGGIALSFMRESKDPINLKLLEKSIIVNSSIECLHNAIIYEKSACFDWDIYGYRAIGTNATINPFEGEFDLDKKQNFFQFATDKNMPSAYGVFLLRKNSLYTNLIDRKILSIFAGGLYHLWDNEQRMQDTINGSRWFKSDLKNFPIENKVKENLEKYLKQGERSIKSLNFSNLFAPFLILMQILALATVAFFAEKFTHSNHVQNLFRNLKNIIKIKLKIK